MFHPIMPKGHDLAGVLAELVITHERAAQTYCELARAVLFHKLIAVNTCARDLPEARRPGVKRFTSSIDALTWLAYASSARLVPDTLPAPAEPEVELAEGDDPLFVGGAS